MNVLRPVMRHPPSTLRAIVLIAATSEPASGSLIPRQKIFSPEMAGTRYLRFCSSEPNLNTGGTAMSVCTATAIASPPESHRVIFGQDDIAEVVAPTAAVLLRLRQSEKAQLPHPLEYVVGETPFPLPFGRVRRELRFDERSDAGSQLIMLGRKRPLRHAGSVLAGKP
jgi:hypothetical protein